ncbi:type I polyketide synthase [Streptomyces chrestomyceticus]|uniref:type I polyketide synthase n=1 Tax=Streptomyces chrestomyceticus TaxID=68185 RepID=UPI0019D266F0|nr:type I polyketide synthase [Streptomyces chrestomyceticus]
MTDNRRDEPIAVIGAGCRYPGGAHSLEALEELLYAGRETVAEVPADRWTQEDLAVLPQPVADRMRWGCFLDGDVYAYEPEFFGVNAQEAAWVDPQQRLLWEVSWEALEHAGIPPLSLAGSRTGLFFGLYSRDYLLRSQRPLADSEPYALYANSDSIGMGRLAFLLDVRGPQLPFEMACASGLAGVHLACQSLRAGEADLALAGGVILHLLPETTAAMAHWLAFSPTGRCCAFDAAANGYVRGEGGGVVVLKRYRDAVRDGDRVLAVLRGSAINQNGRDTRLTAPSLRAQQAVYRQALQRAGAAGHEPGLIEAHGTGTAVGDPIEFAALASVYGAGDSGCALGAVKTNLGHAEPAAGIAGLLKVIVALRRGLIPPTLNFSRWNPQIDTAGARLFVPTQTVPWPVPGPAPRLAAVSAFGISGSNAHMLVEQAPAARSVTRSRSAEPRSPQLRSTGPDDVENRMFLLSGGTHEAVRAGAARLADWLDRPGADAALDDIAYTLSVCRSHNRCRAGVVAGSHRQLAATLRACARGDAAAGLVEGTSLSDTGPGPVWVFSGHGSQWAGMGRSLLDRDRGFTAAIDALEPLIAAESGFSVREALLAPQVVTGADTVQPVIFAMQLGIAAMWRERGVRPAAVIGHSMGEVAAAVTAGALTIQDGVKVICRRSRLALQTPAPGAMASVLLPQGRVAADITSSGIESVETAVLASPGTTVVGGDTDGVRELIAYWEQRDVTARLVEVDYASHTRHMDLILEELTHALRDVVPRPATVPFYSTVRADPRAEVCLDGDYWAANLRRTVQFAPAVKALADDGHRLFMEISPHPLLTSAIQETLHDAGPSEVAVLASMSKEAHSPQAFAMQLAALHCAGHPLPWERLQPHGTFTELPATSWDRHHYEVTRCTRPGTLAQSVPSAHPLLGVHLADPTRDGTHYWQSRIDAEDLPWLQDHQVDGTCVLPATAMIEMALGSAVELFRSEPVGVRVEDIELQHLLPLTEAAEVTCSAHKDHDDSARWEMAVSGEQGAHTAHATALLRRHAATPPRQDIDRLKARHSHDVAAEKVYERFRGGFRLEHGPAFAGLVNAWHRDESRPVSLFAEVCLPDAARRHVRDLYSHPVTLDVCGQAGIAAWMITCDLDAGMLLPVRLASVAVHGDTARGRYCHVRLEQAGDEACTAHLDLLDEKGQVLAELGGLEFVRRPAQSPQDTFSSRLLQTRWGPAPLPAAAPATSGDWMVLDASGTGTAARDLAEALGAQGSASTVAELSASDEEQRVQRTLLDSLRNSVTGDSARPSSVVVMFPTAQDCGADSVPDHARQTVGHLLDKIVKPLLPDEHTAPPRLWVITRGALRVRPDDVPNLGQAGVRGLLRTLSYEHPELHPTTVDVDPRTPAAVLARELLSCPTEQDDIAYRDGQRYTARLATEPLGNNDLRHTLADQARDAVTLDLEHPGDLGSFRFVAERRRPPAPGEVEIRVRATGLSFINVLKALGVYDRFRAPGDGPTCDTFECAGVITAVGEGVTGRKVGDRVAAWVLGSAMGSFARTRAGLTLPVPDAVGLPDAAALLFAHLTAQYALHHLARLRPGETVLVHTASGATGLALIHLAQSRGAHVLATAGTPGKRAFVRRRGVRHVMDSRSLDFADQVRDLTQGRGVDVVLNTLTGPAQSASLGLIAPYGRFIELGKQDIYANTRLGLLPFRRSISFSSVDILAVGQHNTRLAETLCAQVADALHHGALPLLPVTTYPIEDAAAAFRTMAAAQHTGKLVLTWPDQGSLTVPVRPHDVPVVREDGSYLITGGLGGLGLLAARWLAHHGAPHIVLTGRSRPGRNAKRVIGDLRAAGTRVDIVNGDIADPATAPRLVAAAAADGYPLRGVLHCAAVVEDATAARITDDLLDRVWRPKVHGAWHLHHATPDANLDWWVGFSSIASVLGSPGQGAYTAANAWLDEFITWRRAQGLPATGINWGPWARYGRGSGMEERGHIMIEPEDGIAALEQILRHDRPRVGYSPLDIDHWLASYPQTAALEYFADLTAMAHGTGGAPADSDGLLAALHEAPQDERRTLLRDRTAQHIADVLALDPDRCDPNASLTLLGLDSLRAVEIRNRLQRELRLTFPQTALWTHPTIAALTDYLLDRLTEQHSLPTAPAA